MTILILATLVPLCGFYLWALAGFQRELRRTKRTKQRAKPIILWRLAENPSGTVAEGDEPAVTSDKSRREVYEFASAYTGSFVVTPISSADASHGDASRGEDAPKDVTQITYRRAR